MTDEDLQRAEQYAESAQEYLGNAHKSIDDGELSKAGEFLWGAVACLVKAIEMKSGRRLKHREIAQAVGRLALAVGDKSIREDFSAAASLHANYYETFIAEEDFPEYYEKARRVYARLLEILLPS